MHDSARDVDIVRKLTVKTRKLSLPNSAPASSMRNDVGHLVVLGDGGGTEEVDKRATASWARSESQLR